MDKQLEDIGREEPSADISEEFMRMDAFDFLDYLRSRRNDPQLKISVDFTGLADEDQFIAQARRIKAFLDMAKGQKRQASIRCTEEQKMWEPNVFSSAVEWINSGQ